MDLSKILDVTPEPAIKLQESLIGVTDSTNYNNEEDDYCLPTPMADFQKELTDDIVSLHYSDILKYFETNNRDDLLLIDSLQKLYLNIQLISSHPYLLIDHFMPKSLAAKDIPMKLIQTSGKFKMLKNVLDIYSGVLDFRKLLKSELHNHAKFGKQGKLSSKASNSTETSNKKINQIIVSNVKKRFINEITVPSNKNILLISREGRTLDLIESLMLGLKMPYVKYSGSNIKNNNKDKVTTAQDIDIKKKLGSYLINLNSHLKNYLNNNNFNLFPLYNVTVHLLSSKDLEEKNENAMKFLNLYEGTRVFKIDLIIPFDLSVNTKLPIIAEIRNKNYGRKVRRAPILRLVPIFTVEHIALNFDYNNDDGINENFRNTISAVVVERGKVGLIDANFKTIYQNNLDYLRDWLLYSTEDKKQVGNTHINWPLPAIAKIPIYKPQDVEKSLLTEVKYVPEDDYSDFDDDMESKKKSVKDDKLEFDDFEKFERLYLKTPNDYFYDTKRLKSLYMLNPIQIKNRSNIIGIEAESIHFTENDSKTGESSYFDYLTRELILTHFEIYELNLKYLSYNKIDADLKISESLNKVHREDFEVSLDELEKFLAHDKNMHDKLEELVSKKKLLQKILAEKRVEKLEKYFEYHLITKDNDQVDGDKNAKVDGNKNVDGNDLKFKLQSERETVIKNMSSEELEKYKKWEENQLKLLELFERKNSLKKSLSLRQNELDYLNIELEKLGKVYEENVASISGKTDLLNKKLNQELEKFVGEYNNIGENSDDNKSAKRRKMNKVISEVDGLMLSLKHEITVNEDSGQNKNRNRYRRK